MDVNEFSQGSTQLMGSKWATTENEEFAAFHESQKKQGYQFCKRPKEITFTIPFVMPRETWEAVPPNSSEKMVHPVSNVVYHYYTPDAATCHNLKTCAQSMRDLQKNHMNEKKMSDIAYNFVVAGDGMIYEGRGFERVPHHGLRHPELIGDRIDIAYLGDYRKITVPWNMYQKAEEFLIAAIRLKQVSDPYNVISAEEESIVQPGTNYGSVEFDMTGSKNLDAINEEDEFLSNPFDKGLAPGEDPFYVEVE